MTDDKVAAAMREANDCASGMCVHSEIEECHATIARYGEAREKAAIDATGVWRKEIEQEIAAARLAGIEESLELIQNGPMTVIQACVGLRELRDRLRREAGGER